MALLSFPPSPNNNDLYPANPLPGQSQYRYDSTTQTWVLEGAATAVAPGCYGDAYTVPTFCVDAQGRLTFAQNVAIGVTGGTVTSITAGFGLLGGTITTSGTIDLDTSFTDSLYLQLAGGTMAGDIIFSGTQTFPNTVAQVDTGLGLTGGPITATGTISALQATPVSEGIVFGYTDGVSVALGVNALFSISSGINNTAIGDNALLNNGGGNNNTAVGTAALCANTGGSLNTAVGVSSLKNSTGTLNTATGFGALINSTIGSNNAGFGADAGFRLTAGACNTALGTYSLFNTTTGNQNVGVGYSAGCNITTGSQNVAIGPDVTVSSATGSCQLAIGFAANQNWLTGDSAKNIRPGAGIYDCSASLGLAGQSLFSTSTAVEWVDGLKRVAPPTSSGDTGAVGEVAVDTGFFYFFDGVQWLRVAGNTF